LECAFHKNTLGSGSRDGGFILWDIATTSPVHRIRAHQGSITGVEAFEESSVPLFITTGEDGYVKLWDPRGSTATDALTNKIPAHIRADKKNPNMMKGAAISCLGKLSGRGSGLSYIVTGGADNSIVLMDARKSFEIIERWENAKNCIYSLCVVGDNCIFVGDGAGMLLCYDVLSSNALKFGLGSSEMGGVRTINCTANGKIITGNEDGKSIVYSF
jgi:WD40 repeat protein